MLAPNFPFAEKTKSLCCGEKSDSNQSGADSRALWLVQMLIIMDAG